METCCIHTHTTATLNTSLLLRVHDGFPDLLTSAVLSCGELTVLAEVTADPRWTAAAPIGRIAAGPVLTLTGGGAVGAKPALGTRCGVKHSHLHSHLHLHLHLHLGHLADAFIQSDL